MEEEITTEVNARSKQKEIGKHLLPPILKPSVFGNIEKF